MEDMNVISDTDRLISSDDENYVSYHSEEDNIIETSNTCSISMCNCYEKGTVPLNYRGNNMTCCNRHILMGPICQLPCISISALLIIAPIAIHLWIVHTTYYIELNAMPSCIIIIVISSLLLIISIYFLFKTYLIDPGIIPRQTRNHPMMGPLNEYDRFCTTCNVIKSATAKHCSICDNCVQSFDHHCPWTGTCIAERNVCYFVGFLGCTGLLGLVVTFTCIANIFVGSNEVSSRSKIAMLNMLIMMYAAIMSLMLLGMVVNYYWMIGRGLTTNERIKHGGRLLTAAEREREQSNFYFNLRLVFCYPITPSALFVQ